MKYEIIISYPPSNPYSQDITLCHACKSEKFKFDILSIKIIIKTEKRQLVYIYMHEHLSDI
jgi:hypothetical protein